ncbi:hypothetical protein ATANTOWER_026326, partial [Ataeniobius toweri]|nr:hypothetical protein [Ataeniobius toweri]
TLHCRSESPIRSSCERIMGSVSTGISISTAAIFSGTCEARALHRVDVTSAFAFLYGSLKVGQWSRLM